MATQAEFIAHVRRALGRREPLDRAPVPPELTEPIIRLVHTDIGLPGLFARQAAASGMQVTNVRVDDLADKLIELLNGLGCRSVVLPASKLLDPLEIAQQLSAAGITAHCWDATSADAVYDVDAGLTDVYAAIAETGSLVVRAAPEHGRVLSLVPPIHIAVVQPRDVVPDLLDLMRKLEREGTSSGTTIISGPSKTTDIEGNLVIGVHGPGQVHVLLLE
jgi:L-lactate dehydrogenase complex protein LldG